MQKNIVIGLNAKGLSQKKLRTVYNATGGDAEGSHAKKLAQNIIAHIAEVNYKTQNWCSRSWDDPALTN
jgi:hypothetical protein